MSIKESKQLTDYAAWVRVFSLLSCVYVVTYHDDSVHSNIRVKCRNDLWKGSIDFLLWNIEFLLPLNLVDNILSIASFWSCIGSGTWSNHVWDTHDWIEYSRYSKTGWNFQTRMKFSCVALQPRARYHVLTLLLTGTRTFSTVSTCIWLGKKPTYGKSVQILQVVLSLLTRAIWSHWAASPFLHRFSQAHNCSRIVPNFCLNN